MARKKETLLRRIARHTGHTEDSLREFLDSKNNEHLIWTGSGIESAPRAATAARGGLPYRRGNRPFKPRLKGDIDPARILFCHVHNLASLDSRIRLRPCSERKCISPFHRQMIATYSRRWEDRVTLPDIGTPGEAQALNQELQELADFLKADEQVARAQTIDEIAAGIYSREEVILVLQHLGWSIPR